MSSKILVAYFSATGVTEKAAKILAKAAGGELYQIKPKVKYTSSDLDWTNNSSRSTVEMHDKNSRPDIITDFPSFSSFSHIFLIFPIWWYTAPHIINSFLESYDFAGKHVVLFATSGGSNIEKSVKDLQNTYTRIRFDGGKKIIVGTSQDELKAWAGKYIS